MPVWGPGGVMAVPTDGQAKIALGVGLAGILLCCWVLGPVAFYIGHSSVSRIRNSGGALSGLGLAQTGRILGAVETVLLVGAVVYGIYGIVFSALNAH